MFEVSNTYCHNYFSELNLRSEVAIDIAIVKIDRPPA